MTEQASTEKSIFLSAIELGSPADRAAYLDEACAGDAELRGRIAALMLAHETPPGILDSKGANASAIDRPESTARPGVAIGPYKLLQQIGEGGMGTVYMAEQTHPVQRKVALKVIKPGMDSRLIIARFEAERQALAIMDHVNIARVLDAGTTASGLPYFVMELVNGLPITKYCDDNHLTPRERLELFVPVCQAIQHAHQKGIIHRDIKPSNVMVTLYDGKPVPKVIDFGVAKAMQRRLTERTLFTQYGGMVGTFEYMSPEQAEMSALGVDTRSDIYSLGVLLYELLTGSTPLTHQRLQEAALAEVLRMIKEEEPPKPSTRLSDSGEALASISAKRHMEPAKLTKLIRGDLDWIVMKCLEKDRNRRYDTASGLAIELQRYLSGDAVQAAPPSRIYRFKKFVRRNQGPVIASASIVVALIAGIIGTTIGLLGQSRQRAIADEQRAEAQKQEIETEKMAAIALAMSQFQCDMFASARPDKSGEKVTVMEVMVAALKALDAGKLSNQPLAEANVREMIGETLSALGRDVEAVPNLRKTLDLRRKVLAPNHWAISRTLQSLALMLEESGNYSEAESLLREALALRRANLPSGHVQIGDTLAELGYLLQVEGKYSEAEPMCREAVEIARKNHPAGHIDIAFSLGRLGWLLQVEDKFTEAEALCREALEIRRRNLRPAHPDIANSLNHLAVVLARSKRLQEAEPLFREMLEIECKSLPAGHPRIGQSTNNLATVLQEQGKHAEAEPLQREGLRLRRESLPAGHPDIAQSLKNLAVLLSEQGKLAEAEPLAREALSIRRTAFPAGHPDIAGSLQNLGSILKDQRKFADGETSLLEAERILIAAPGLPAAKHQECIETLVRLYSAWNQAEPGKGHDGKAEHWKAKLIANKSATSPPP